MFLRDEWYLAAFARELGDKPFQRTICAEPLALFRTASGKAAALADRCPHRGAPLSTGEVHGETLACGYHGFVFDTAGLCVGIPGSAVIPPKTCVRSFPVVERWGCIFVWMGKAERADEARLPDFRWLTEPGWAGGSEYLHVKANYALVRDNLLDLTHARFVHKQTLATTGVTEYPLTSDVEGRRVRVTREMPGIEPSPFFKRVPGFKGNVDHRQRIDFYPPCYVLINTVVQSVPEMNDDRVAEFYVLNALVPETETSTHYFWGLMRKFAVDDQDLTQLQLKLNRETFQEDVDLLEKQQVLLSAAPPDWSPISIPADAGCVQADRMMKKLFAAEDY